MLVLSRNKDQSILIGENIIVKILEFHGGQIKIGITAPLNLIILWDELKRKVKRTANLNNPLTSKSALNDGNMSTMEKL